MSDISICFLSENLLHWLAEHKGDKSDHDQSDDIKSDEEHGIRVAHENSLHHHQEQTHLFLFNKRSQCN